MVSETAASSERPITPFLKWAGGKRWLVRSCPELLRIPFERYFEPFVGSGAVFFSLRPKRAMLSDANTELISTYAAVKSDWNSVWGELEHMQRRHNPEFYYATRASRPTSDTAKAARFLYLNRTCWNALYRVNRRGEFNVPIGTKTDVLAGGDLSLCAAALKDAELAACDFAETMRKATRGDLVYLDPPYTVRHNVNGFLKYNETLFTWDDQVRLRDEVVAAYKRGVRVIVSNAAHQSVRELYSDVGETRTVERASVIAGKSSARRREQEIVVLCL